MRSHHGGQGSPAPHPGDSDALAAVKSGASTEQPDNGPSLFFNLPAELRNRIYTYALNIIPESKLRHRSGKTVQEDMKIRGIALTQTCQQIRAEYRPLYLKNSTIVLNWPNFFDFLSTFYKGEYNGGPRNLIVCYDQDKDAFFQNPVNIGGLMTLACSINHLRIIHHWHASSMCLKELKRIAKGSGFSDFLQYSSSTFTKFKGNEKQRQEWVNDLQENKFKSITSRSVPDASRISTLILFNPGAAPPYFYSMETKDASDMYLEHTGLSQVSGDWRYHDIVVSMAKSSTDDLMAEWDAHEHLLTKDWWALSEDDWENHHRYGNGSDDGNDDGGSE